jgi:hypothetical protein
MTTITFGGGPSVESRRQFSNLKPGSQVPGYDTTFFDTFFNFQKNISYFVLFLLIYLEVI